jgi:flavin-dependent dehydrogenase
MADRKSWDLLILGAGPAGCAAAIEARRAKLSVLMLETAGRHRPTPGETLHPGIEAIFSRLGLRKRVLAQRFHRHRGVWIDWNKPRRFEAYGEDARGAWLGFQADRRRLHELMRETAIDVGAEVMTSIAPKALILSDSMGVKGVTTRGTAFQARWTADATGRQAWLAGKLNLTRTCRSPAMLARFGWNDDANADLDGQPCIKAIPNGWSWVAPLGNGRSAWVSLMAGAPGGQLGARIGTDVSWRTHRDCAGQGYLLLGDAAAVLDPLSSHGVLRAMMSGMLCGHLVSAHRDQRLSESEVIGRYASWMTQQFDADVSALRTLYLDHPSDQVAALFK